MSEIEKMYENAGIKMQHLLDVDTNQFVDVYPPFTAEKQLAIIKRLCLKDEWNFLCYIAPCTHRWVLNISDTPIRDEWEEFKMTVMGENEEPFGEVLAKLVNSLWQELTEEERKQIKEILS